MEGEKDGFPVTAMREIKLLQSLKQANVIRLHEMMVSKGQSCPLYTWSRSDYVGSVYMVFDYMDHDLTGVLSHPGITFSPANLKSLNHQMIAGLGYLHTTGILHRDMKGSNILLDAQGVLKLADFGLARLYNRKRKADYTNRVITLWYRSPELLMGETAYGPEVDMWSAGYVHHSMMTSTLY
jgi:CTD kinase subunit alpha